MIGTVSSWAAAGSAVAALASMINTIRVSNSARQMTGSQNLFSIAQQWNQSHFRDRLDAEAFIIEHPELELPEAHETSADFSSLYHIFEFFELLQSSIDFKLIPRREAHRMFLFYFVWWDIVAAKANYPTRWDRAGRLKKLRRRMQQVEYYPAMCDWAIHDLGERLRGRGIAETNVERIIANVRGRLSMTG